MRRGTAACEDGLATLRLIFTLSIVAGVLSIAVGLVAASYSWLAPPLRPQAEQPALNEQLTISSTPPDRTADQCSISP